MQINEAWIFFKNKAGDTIEDPKLQPAAIEITKRLAGLLIAIVTIATTLTNKTLPIWSDALQQMVRPGPRTIRGVDAKVFSSLELSYKHLQGDEVKSFFLLCAISPSNHINREDLLYRGMGLY